MKPCPLRIFSNCSWFIAPAPCARRVSGYYRASGVPMKERAPRVPGLPRGAGEGQALTRLLEGGLGPLGLPLTHDCVRHHFGLALRPPRGLEEPTPHTTD